MRSISGSKQDVGNTCEGGEMHDWECGEQIALRGAKTALHVSHRDAWGAHGEGSGSSHMELAALHSLRHGQLSMPA